MWDGALEDHSAWSHPLHFLILVKIPSGMKNINFITVLVASRQQPTWCLHRELVVEQTQQG